MFVEKLLSLDFHRVPRLLDLAQQGLFLILGLLLLRLLLIALFSDSALLGLHVELDVDLHRVLLLVLLLVLQLFGVGVELLDLGLLREDLLREL